MSDRLIEADEKANERESERTRWKRAEYERARIRRHKRAIKWAWALLALCITTTLAHAALRGSFWLILTQSASAPTGTGVTSKDRLWVKSSNDHLMHTDTSNVDHDLEAGGGGTMSIGGTVTSGTANSVLFVAAGPVLAQDNAQFWWDDSGLQLHLKANSSSNSPNLILDNTVTTGSSLEGINFSSGGSTVGDIVFWPHASGAFKQGLNLDTNQGVIALNATTQITGGQIGTRRAIADTAATVATTDFIVAYTSITATRIATLPNANVGAGTQFFIGDESGSVTSAIKINVQSAGGTIDGIAAGTGVNIVVPRCFAGYESDGTNWHTIDGLNCYPTTSIPPRGLAYGAGTAPTLSLGAAAGSTATKVNPTGTDSLFKFSITASGSGITSGTWATVTFNGTWPHKPACWVQENIASPTSTVIWTFVMDNDNSTTTTINLINNYNATGATGQVDFWVTCFDPGVNL